MWFFKSKSKPVELEKAEPQTIDDWLKKLKGSKDVRELLPLINSSMSKYEKNKVLAKVHHRIFKNARAVEAFEEELQRSGNHYYRQAIRMRHFYVAKLWYGYAEWAQDVVNTEIKGRWIVQREIYVREELRALLKSRNMCSCGADDPKISEYEQELRRLDVDYQNNRKLQWNLRGRCRVGPLQRAFESARNSPDWALSLPWLRKDCAGRGGCCARNCGCCEKKRDTHRDVGLGHCTSACACCIRTKGTSPDTGKFTDLKDYPFDLTDIDVYYNCRILVSYIWGIDW